MTDSDPLRAQVSHLRRELEVSRQENARLRQQLRQFTLAPQVTRNETGREQRR
jgi:hypothetical protein